MVNYNKIGLGLIFGAIGIIVFLQSLLGEENSTRLGLLLFAFGFLIMVFGVVMGRLRKLGAEYWAIGSFFVYLGFVIASIPIFIFVISPDFVSIWLQWVILFIGILFVILGFGTEMYDLNIVFLNFVRKVSFMVRMGWKKFTYRLTHSYLTLPLILLSLYLISMLFSDSEKYLIDLSGGYLNEISAMGLVSSLILLLSLIESRELVKQLLVTIINFSQLLVRVIVRWITQFPRVVKTTSIIFLRFIVRTGKALRLIAINSWFLAFLLFPFYLYFGITTGDDVLLAISFFLLVMSFALFSIKKPEVVDRVVNSVGDRVVRRSIRVKEYVKNHPTVSCKNCGKPLSHQEMLMDHCRWCNIQIEKCGVCYLMIGEGESSISCPHCQNSGHYEHLEGWTSKTGKCPYCRKEWRVRTA